MLVENDDILFTTTILSYIMITVISRKMRIKLEGRGKSGGGRVIYLDVFEKEHLYLLFAYPKNVQEDLTSEQKKAIQRMIEIIRKE